MPVFTPGPDSLTGYASVFSVVRFHRDLTGDDRFEALPNIKCESIHWTRGAVVPSAQFSYVLDSVDPTAPFPKHFEDLWPLAAGGPYVVLEDDELIVYEYLGDERFTAFHGFAELPQVDFTARGMAVSFVCSGVGKRLWDKPLQGAVYRDAEAPHTGEAVGTDLPIWFNPNNKPNRTPDGYDENEGDPNAYPVFLDAGLATATATAADAPSFWTLGDFIRHLFWVYNADEDWVKNPVPPTSATLDDYLQAAAPFTPGGYMDLSNPATYTLEPIVIRSFDVTGKALLEAAEEQLNYFGFQVTLNCRDDPDDPGVPLDELIIYRDDGRDGNAPKELFSAPDGSLITDGVSDFDSISLVRDGFEPANEYEIETAEVEYELSVVLAPGFTIAAGDASSLDQFNHSALANATADARKKYRYFVFDEVGLGHWDFDSATLVTGTATSLDDVLGAPDGDVRAYVHRFRPGKDTVFAIDDAGTPRRSELALSRDYAGAYPAVWDGTGTWRSLGQSGWKADKTALAVWLTCDNPESWKLPKAADAIGPGDVARVVTSLADPSGPDTKFFLRYTTVIKGDKGIEALAAKRDASPMKFAVRRLIDSKDHWVKQVVDKSSVFNPTGADFTLRDDTPQAQAHADAMRLAREFPTVSGPLRVPCITHAYGIGDQLSYINGRDIDLTSNAGAPAGEGPRYPSIVGFSWMCQNPQSTTFKLCDRRGEPEGASHGYGRSR